MPIVLGLSGSTAGTELLICPRIHLGSHGFVTVLQLRHPCNGAM